MVRATGRASICALEDQDGAAAAMQAAFDAWTAAGLPLDHAFAVVCALHVLAPSDLSQADIARARSYLEGLREASLLRRYDAASA